MAVFSTFFIFETIKLYISSVSQSSFIMSSAPISSVVSPKTIFPPREQSFSAKIPREGLEAMPDVKSEPPHSRPTVRFDISVSTFSVWESISSNFLHISMPVSTVLVVPPISCITIHCVFGC